LNASTFLGTLFYEFALFFFRQVFGDGFKSFLTSRLALGFLRTAFQNGGGYSLTQTLQNIEWVSRAQYNVCEDDIKTVDVPCPQ
jgi:hypothetical protein